MGNFKKLNVWLKAKNIAVNIYKITDSALFNKDFSLKDQMRRSAVSIPSNIAEGDTLDTNKQRVRYFHIARGSTAELRTQLIISMEVGYINPDIFKELELECDEIGAMITSLIKHRLNKTSNH